MKFKIGITSCPDCPVFLEVCCSCPLLIAAEIWKVSVSFDFNRFKISTLSWNETDLDPFFSISSVGAKYFYLTIHLLELTPSFFIKDARFLFMSFLPPTGRFLMRGAFSYCEPYRAENKACPRKNILISKYCFPQAFLLSIYVL